MKTYDEADKLYLFDKHMSDLSLFLLLFRKRFVCKHQNSDSNATKQLTFGDTVFERSGLLFNHCKIYTVAENLSFPVDRKIELSDQKMTLNSVVNSKQRFINKTTRRFVCLFNTKIRELVERQ